MQVETALLNMAINARDAMPNGGSLIVGTNNAAIDQQYTAREVGVDPGEYVRISVSDTGKDMPGEMFRKVFEPFFTTQKSWSRYGLCLSMDYGFA